METTEKSHIVKCCCLIRICNYCTSFRSALGELRLSNYYEFWPSLTGTYTYYSVDKEDIIHTENECLATLLYLYYPLFNRLTPLLCTQQLLYKALVTLQRRRLAHKVSDIDSCSWWPHTGLTLPEYTPYCLFINQ